MIFKYGGYSFTDNEVGLQIHRRGIYSQRGRKMWDRVTWIINGVKIADDAAALTTELQLLEAACATDGGDLLFLDNNGAPTAHSTASSACVNGIQVKGPVQYPGGTRFWGMGTEYVNLRSYRVTFEGDVMDADDDLLYHSETYTKIGSGGPYNIWQESFLGAPQWQQPKLFTKCRLIQQGNALGLSGTPAYAAPLYGNPYIRNDLSMIEPGEAKNQGINYQTHWPIRWRYVFEGPTAF